MKKDVGKQASYLKSQDHVSERTALNPKCGKRSDTYDYDYGT